MKYINIDIKKTEWQRKQNESNRSMHMQNKPLLHVDQRAERLTVRVSTNGGLKRAAIVLNAVVGAYRKAAEAFSLIIIHGGGGAHGKPAGVSIGIK
jgi:hypothetical protein